jgi:hypothetical protein
MDGWMEEKMSWDHILRPFLPSVYIDGNGDGNGNGGSFSVALFFYISIILFNLYLDISTTLLP